ncbi:MAG: PP2C family protein-serine/threonine phosphatase [Tepidisphaeraceae bacterium]|jgi:serine phosphatase RsbU (regulator of sigma subunit)
MPVSAQISPMSDQQIMACMEIWGGNESIDTSIRMPGLDAWVYAKPYKRASSGGDVHYVSSCATGRITRLLLADVSGHGEEVDGVARLLRDLMRQFVNFVDQTRFVRSMNQRFAAVSASNIFATALVTTFFSPTRMLTLSNAGHPPPILYRAASGTWSILESKPTDADGGPANIPLGIIDSADYSQLEVRLETGDFVLLYTDSLIESRDGDGEFLGPTGVLSVLKSLFASEKQIDAALVIPKLLLAISSLHANNLHDDDVTALLIRANGSGAKVPFKDKLLAPARIIRGVVTSLLNGGKALPIPEMTIRSIGGALIDRLSQR